MASYSRKAIESYVKLRLANRIVCDFTHCQRVWKLARKLGTQKFDEDILHAAAFLHDISLAKDHEKRSADIAARVLRRYMDPADIYRVQEAIKNHTITGKPKSVEAILIHDADLLDYLGAEGFVRLSLAAAHWHNKTDPKEILKYISNMKRQIGAKLVLKHSKSIAADKMLAMEYLINVKED